MEDGKMGGWEDGENCAVSATPPYPHSPTHPLSHSQPVGRHLLADFWTGDVEALRWAAGWERLLPEACRAAGATVLGMRFHQFEPHGVTGVVLLAESHASVHTWPERGLATLDVFTCGSMNTGVVIEAVRAALHPVRERVTAVERGRPPSS